MKRELLLGLIDRAQDVEEDAVAIFSRHVSSAIDWCGCPRDEISRVKAILKRLENDSKSHSKILEGLKDRILKSRKIDF